MYQGNQFLHLCDISLHHLKVRDDFRRFCNDLIMPAKYLAQEILKHRGVYEFFVFGRLVIRLNHTHYMLQVEYSVGLAGADMLPLHCTSNGVCS